MCSRARPRRCTRRESALVPLTSQAINRARSADAPLLGTARRLLLSVGIEESDEGANVVALMGEVEVEIASGMIPGL